MFDQLFQLIKDHTSDALSSNPDITSDQKDIASQEATSSILETLKEKVSQGDLSGITSFFNAETSSGSPIAGAAIENLTGRLSEKLGISTEQAQSVAETLMPGILEKFVAKANDPNDSTFNLENMVSQFTGSSLNLGGILGTLGKNPNS